MTNPLTRLIWARAVNRFGDGFFSIGVTWLIFTHTHSVVLLGVLWGAYLLLVAVLTSVLGPLVDRWARQRLLLGINGVQAILVLIPPFLWLLGAFRLWELYPAFLLVGLVAIPAGPAVSAMLPGLAGGEALDAANARLAGATEAMYLVGPAVGGVFLAYFGALSGLVVDGASFVAAGLLVASLPQAGAVAARVVERYAAAIRDGFALLWRDMRLLRLAALSVLVSFTDAAFIVLSVPLVRLVLHGTTASVGFLEGSLSAGVLVGAWLVRRRTLGAWPRVRQGLVVLFCVATALIGVVPLLAWALMTQVVAGVADGVFQVEWEVAFQQGVPDAQRGRAFMGQRAAARVASAVGAVMAAGLAAIAGVSAAFLALGLCGAVLATSLLAGLGPHEAAPVAFSPRP